LRAVPPSFLPQDVVKLAVAADGTVYANTWSGPYYHNDAPPPGGFLLALKDSGGTRHADIVERFGASVADGAAGGTEIAVYHDAIYAKVNNRIVRYPLRAGEIAPGGKPETILSACRLPATRASARRCSAAP
jgi:hypothetical protein